MNTKQIFLIFVVFFITLLILTMPLWVDWAMPYIKDYLNSAIVTLENWYEFLKIITGEVVKIVG
jgi:hypothetical protein